MIFGLSPAGLRVKNFDEIFSELLIAIRAEFGPEAASAVVDLLRQYLGIFAEREATVQDLLKGVYDSFYPSSSEGFQLENVCDITGITRLPATKSTVIGKCGGDPGTPIIPGRIASVINTGARFLSLAGPGGSTPEIGPGGTVDVTFEAENAGPIAAPAGSLTVIETPVTGWNTIINEADANVGRAIETDTELRIRRLESLQVVGAATVDAIRSRILDDVPNVTDAFVHENDTDITDGEGRPPHSVQVIVAGGDDQDIADKIWEVKSAGIATFGAETVVVTDSMGFDHDVNFDRADIRLVWFHVELTVAAGFDTGTKQKEKLTIATDDVGETLTVSINGRDYSITTTGDPDADSGTFAANINSYAANGWIPVIASHSGGDDFFTLESTYPGNAFILDWVNETPSGTSEIEIDTEQINSGDQESVIASIIAFADGTEVIPKEQKIGVDVFRDRYKGPINLTPEIETIDIQTSNGLEDASYWPLNAPGGGAWAFADVVVDSDEVGELDTLRVTVEIV